MLVLLAFPPLVFATSKLNSVEAVYFFHSKCNYRPDKMPSLTEAAQAALENAKRSKQVVLLCPAIEESYAYVENEWRLNNIDDERRDIIKTCLKPLESFAAECKTNIWLDETTVVMNPQDVIPSKLARVRHFSVKTDNGAEYFNLVLQSIPEGNKGEEVFDEMLEFLDDAESKANK